MLEPVEILGPNVDTVLLESLDTYQGTDVCNR